MNDLLATIPTVGTSVPAGHPTDFDVHIESISLIELLTNDPESCLLLKVTGDSLEDVPIVEGDWLLLDRAANPKENDIIIFRLNDGFGAKRFATVDAGKKGLYLVPANGGYSKRQVTASDSFEILGTVKWVFHNF